MCKLTLINLLAVPHDPEQMGLLHRSVPNPAPGNVLILAPLDVDGEDLQDLCLSKDLVANVDTEVAA